MVWLFFSCRQPKSLKSAENLKKLSMHVQVCNKIVHENVKICKVLPH